MPDSALQLAAAHRHFAAGEHDRSAQICRQLQRDADAGAEAAFLLGRIAAAAQRPVDAEASYREALAAGESAEAYNNLGNAVAAQRRFDEAVANYRRALALAPQYVEALNNLGNALRELEQLDEAEAALRAALVRRPAYAEAHNNLALVLRRRGNAQEARQHYQLALRYRPDYPQARNNLGILLAAEGDVVAAIAEFETVLRAHPDYAQARRNLALALQDAGRDEAALAVYDELLLANPADADGHWQESRVLARLGRHDAAHEAVLRAVSLAPQRAQWHAAAAQSWLHRGHATGALFHARRAAHLATGCYDELLQQAQSLSRSQRTDQPDQKLQQLRTAAEDDAASAAAWLDYSRELRLRGQADEAVAALRRAAELAPDDDRVQFALGEAIALSGAPTEALPLLLATAEDSEIAARHAAVGEAHRQQQNRDAATAAYRRATACADAQPAHFSALGGLLRDAGDATGSIEVLQRGLQRHPDAVELYNNLGISLARLEQYESALAAYKAALRRQPRYADAYNNQGIALARLARREEAADSYRQALRVRSDYPEAHNNLGITLTELGDCDAALEHYAAALAVKPDYAAAYSNRGITLTEQGRLAEAHASYAEALRIDPHYADGHMNRSLVRLLTGDFAAGWKEYEWRWKCGHARMPAMTQPLWTGQPLDGKRIVIHAEQGLGDTLQFVRLLRLVQRRGAHVTFMCQKALLPLIARTPGIDRLLPKIMDGDLPACDYHAPLLGLPRVLGLDASNIPAEAPYVSPDPVLLERWSARLDRSARLRVGINWQGNPQYRGDRQRSIPLVHFAPLGRLPGVRLYSLQKNFGREQLLDAGVELAVTDLGPHLDEQSGPFMDTAALATTLDVVITSDTAVAHLCGAVGARTWLALPYAADWRWLRDIETSPWYPTMRLFRQPQPGDWSAVFNRIAEELESLASELTAARPPLIPVAPGELLDKISILRIKQQRIDDAEKRRCVSYELAQLDPLQPRPPALADELDRLLDDLMAVNEQLWDIEDEIRLCERAAEFGPRFVELARSVYLTNDRRAAVKRAVNELLGSELREEKSYVDYAAAAAPG